MANTRPLEIPGFFSFQKSHGLKRESTVLTVCETQTKLKCNDGKSIHTKKSVAIISVIVWLAKIQC